MPSGAGQPPASATSVPLRSTSTSSTTATTTSDARIDRPTTRCAARDLPTRMRQRGAEEREHDRKRHQPGHGASSPLDDLLLVGDLVVHHVGAADRAVADVVLDLVVAR